MPTTLLYLQNNVVYGDILFIMFHTYDYEYETIVYVLYDIYIIFFVAD